MTDLVKVTVRLPRSVHAEVRARAFREGVTLDGLGRRWFEDYASVRRAAAAEQDQVEGLKEAAAGLAAGEPDGTVAPRREGSSGFESRSAVPDAPAPAASPAFRPDPKKGK